MRRSAIFLVLSLLGCPAQDLDGDGYDEGVDCDDTDRAVFPGADERCNDVDDDCDDVIDEGGGPTWYRDADADGYGDIDASVAACDALDGFVQAAGDCDDRDAAVYPGALEPDCGDPVDHNCDGQVGLGDADGDGWNACEECDDRDADVHPGATERCDGVDEDCDGDVDDHAIDDVQWFADDDGDRYGDPDRDVWRCDPPDDHVRNDDDCDDDDHDVHPGATEHCDGVDEDCDDRVDEGACPAEDCDDGWDDDRDGRVDCEDPDCEDDPACEHGACPDGNLGTALGQGIVTGWNEGEGNDRAGSCGGRGEEVTFRWAAPDDGFYVFDTDGSAYDTVLYALEGDCDGAERACSDDFWTTITWGVTSSFTLELFARDTVIVVVDADGMGDTGRYVLNVRESACPDENLGSETGIVAAGSTAEADDTLTASCASAFGGDVTFSWEAPYGAVWTFDTGGSDFYAALVLRSGGCHGPEIACAIGRWDAGAGIWQDARVTTWVDGGERVAIGLGGDYRAAGAYYLGICEAITWFRDGDGDGYGDVTSGTQACEAPPGYVGDARDCDDADAAVRPGVEETCDGRDQDCDLEIDEGVTSTWYRDADDDASGDPGTYVEACVAPPGYAADARDCDDADAAVRPGAEETCDGRDEDCDGEVDEGCDTGGLDSVPPGPPR